MSTREWYAVETASGKPADGGTEHPNREAAEACCRTMVSGRVEQLTVVRYTRTELCGMQREITIRETPIPPTVTDA